VDTDLRDEELVIRCCEHGDEAAFTELVRRHREQVFRLAVSILGPKFVGEAEEVAQEAFIRVHQTLSTFRREAKFSSWLYRITFNLALNVKARTRYRAPHVSIQAIAETAVMEEESSEGDFIRSQILSECVMHLPEAYQSALRLYYWMEYSVSEISELLAVPENTVKSYLHRARLLLRAMLEEKGYTNE
jgi:RNA polymerase sigma-70 factor (ECF subfamily)